VIKVIKLDSKLQRVHFLNINVNENIVNEDENKSLSTTSSFVVVSLWVIIRYSVLTVSVKTKLYKMRRNNGKSTNTYLQVYKVYQYLS